MQTKQSTLRVNNVDLRVLEQGAGQPALVFLHYWGGSAETWSDTIRHLAPHHRCIAFDFRGWGASSKGQLDYRLDALAADTLALLATLALPNYILVGHSMGGKVAQLVAAQHPKGLAGLVLVAPAPPTPLTTPRETRAQIRACLETPEGVSQILTVLAHGALTDAHRALVIQNTIAGDPAAKDAWLETGMDQDITQAAAKVTVPILVIAGENDTVEPEAALRTAFSQHYPGTRYILLAASGHLIPLQAPGELAAAIHEVAREFHA